jgi:hypothetical protein
MELLENHIRSRRRPIVKSIPSCYVSKSCVPKNSEGFASFSSNQCRPNPLIYWFLFPVYKVSVSALYHILHVISKYNAKALTWKFLLIHRGCYQKNTKDFYSLMIAAIYLAVLSDPLLSPHGANFMD